MFVVRLAGVLGLLALLGCVGIFLYTRDRRYLTWAWRIVQLMMVFIGVIMALYILERLVFVV